MTCPVCGAAELTQESRDLGFTYKGKSTTIRDIHAAYCPACGEAIMGPENAERYMAAIGHFKREVDSMAVSPDLVFQGRPQ